MSRALAPVTELRRFLRASLVTPVPRDHQDSPAALRRRRVVTALTLVVGTALLWWSLALRPGDPLFYVGTAALALTWIAGALLSGPLYLGRGHLRTGFLQVDHAEQPATSGGELRADGERTAYSLPILQSLALGTLLLPLFLAGALVVAQVPLLAGPVEDLLDHARYGALPLVLLITVVNGIAEELFFRGALYAAIPRRVTVIATTLIYAATTVVAGVPLLVLAGVLLGLVCGLQRRVTGGILGPAITHITWSSGMLLLLPPLMEALR
ncbi:CPBP family intramembrane glutamic endopeptidase [Ornithinimicrobium panacihumi]|uniref:CPBP family intramembrane glutamic endopeptidase n=1 Tax=Ornithinimicrobium panacihumi TaxID=2008449 RepID=UPI003F8A30E5